MKTATIERYHVWGTGNHCLAMLYGGQELTPRDTPSMTGHRALVAWIPDDAAGMERLLGHARTNGFTHVRFTGDWSGRTKPKGGKL